MNSLPCKICLLFAAFLAVAMMPSCSVGDSLSPTDAPSSAVPVPGAASPPPVAVPADGSIAVLSTAQAVRRLALDLTLRLPSASDMVQLTANSGKTAPLVIGYLNDRASAQALASLHPRMWHLASGSLPDLDGFVAAGDQTLGDALTAAERLQIVQEPAIAVRYVLEQGLPWRSLYTGHSILAPASLLPLWQATDLGPVFLNEPSRFATAFGVATAAGLLVDPGFLAGYSSHQDVNLRQRTEQIFSEILCLSEASSEVHKFSDLTAVELSGDLNALALQKKACAGCHSIWEGASQAYSGYASGTSLAVWLKATPPASVSGTFGGAAWQGLSGLAKLVGSDARMQRCEVLRLFEELSQRQYSDDDQTTLATALDAFHAKGESLTAAAQVIATSDPFAYAPLPATVKGAVKRSQSGVKFLTRAHWEALMAALLPQNTLQFPDQLDPGHDETFNQSDRVPTGSYWHAVDRLARQAAAAIVAEELADQALATNRRLLTALPDGAAAGAGGGTAAQQIQAIWLQLTGVQLTAKDQIFIDLQTLWSQTAPGASAAESRRAWRTVLTGVFSHPAFVTY